MNGRLNSLRFFGPAAPELEQTQTGFALRSCGGESFTVRLWGRFPAGWCGSLSVGLSRLGIDIVRGFARRVSQGVWAAEFEIRTTPGGTRVSEIDYVELAETPASFHDTPPIELDSYFLDGSPEAGGALYLEVRGHDRMGFLGSLLERLAGLSLFPEEMTVETRGQRANDSFYLRAAEGRVPSEAARRALRDLLEVLARRSPAAERSASAQPY